MKASEEESTKACIGRDYYGEEERKGAERIGVERRGVERLHVTPVILVDAAVRRNPEGQTVTPTRARQRPRVRRVHPRGHLVTVRLVRVVGARDDLGRRLRLLHGLLRIRVTVHMRGLGAALRGLLIGRGFLMGRRVGRRVGMFVREHGTRRHRPPTMTRQNLICVWTNGALGRGVLRTGILVGRIAVVGRRLVLLVGRRVGRRGILLVGRRLVRRVGRLVVGRLTVGRLVAGRLAVGRLAVGRLAVGRLAVGLGRLARRLRSSRCWSISLDSRMRSASCRASSRSSSGDAGTRLMTLGSLEIIRAAGALRKWPPRFLVFASTASGAPRHQQAQASRMAML